MPRGVCKLCLKTKNLQDSHLLPAAVWRRLREPTHKLQHPILMTEKVALTTSSQIHDYVLCRDCEQLLSKNGEAYAARLMCGKTRFPLMERLRVAPPVDFRIGTKAYSGSAIGVDTDKLAYFALSVVWRAAVHQWKSPHSNQPIYSINVGPFLEPMRRYLLGTGPFPADVAVNVIVATDDQSQRTAYTPSLAAGASCMTFGLLVCGIHFAISMANPLPSLNRKGCCYNTPDHLIFEKDLKHQTTRAFNRLYATTHVTAKLRRK